MTETGLLWCSLINAMSCNKRTSPQAAFAEILQVDTHHAPVSAIAAIEKFSHAVHAENGARNKSFAKPS